MHWLSGTLALPVWALGAGAAAFVFVLVLAVHRPGIGRRAALLARNALVVLALVLAGAVLGRLWPQERVAARWPIAASQPGSAAPSAQAGERQALEARARELTGRGLAPGSALACLANGVGAAGEAVEAGCEKAVFASAETTAAAIAYTAERLALLADSLDYAQRLDAGFAAGLEPWRHAVESDRFGLVAQVLASRDGCTADTCNRFALFRDASAVKNNLRAHTYEGLVAQYSESWKARPSEGAAAVAAVAPGAPHGPMPVVRNIDFPSSASIPQISIMAPEPAAPPGGPAPTPGAPGTTTGSVAPGGTNAAASARHPVRHAPSPNGAQASTHSAPAAKPPAAAAPPPPLPPPPPAHPQPGEAGQ